MLKKRQNHHSRSPRRLSGALAWAALLVSLNLTLASCWFVWDELPGSDSTEPEAEPTATFTAPITRLPWPTRTPTEAPPVSTPRPMTTRTPVPTPTPTPSPTPTPVVSEADLTRVLITEEDLTGNWSPSSTINLGADDERSICNNPGPDTVIEPLARAEVQFQQSDLGPFVAETVTAYRTEAEAREIMEYLREATACDEWNDEGRDLDWEVSPLRFPAKGDESFSIELRTSFGFVASVDLHAVFVRTDEVITLVGYGALGGVDTADTEKIVDLALERLADLP